MDKTFDPTKLVSITPNRRKTEPFDMRYTKGRKFRFSGDVWTEFDLNSKGISMFKYPGIDGIGVVITVQSEDKSQALKMRAGYDSKGREFTSSELAKLLGLSDQQTDFTLTYLSQTEEVSYLLVSPYTVKNFGTPPDATPEKEPSTKKKSESKKSTDETVSDTQSENIVPESGFETVVKGSPQDGAELDAMAFSDSDEAEAKASEDNDQEDDQEDAPDLGADVKEKVASTVDEADPLGFMKD